MRSLLTKSAMLALAALCHIGTPSTKPSTTDKVATGGGTVVVEGDNLVSELDNPSDNITAIQLKNSRGEYIVLGGCGASSCITEIPAKLPCGTYTAKVFNTGGSFKKSIYICVR